MKLDTIRKIEPWIDRAIWTMFAVQVVMTFLRRHHLEWGHGFNLGMLFTLSMWRIRERSCNRLLDNMQELIHAQRERLLVADKLLELKETSKGN